MQIGRAALATLWADKQQFFSGDVKKLAITKGESSRQNNKKLQNKNKEEEGVGKTKGGGRKKAEFKSKLASGSGN